MNPVGLQGRNALRLLAALTAFVLTALAYGGAPGSVLSAAGAPTEDFQGEQLVVQAYGGTIAKAWDEMVVQPFNKQYDARITIVEGLTNDTLAKLRAQKGNPSIDAWMMADAGAVGAKNEGLVEPLDPRLVPALNDLVPSALAPGSAYAAWAFTSTAIMYDINRVKNPPQHWMDLAQPQYKGHVLLPGTATIYGVVLINLLAHLNGGSVDNVDPGFVALKKLKPNVLTFWTGYDQITNLFANGDATVAVTSTDRSAALKLSGAPVNLVIPSEGSILIGNQIGVSAGTKHRTLAMRYVNYVLQAAQEKAICDKTVFTPTNRNVQLSLMTQYLLPKGEALKNSITLDWRKVAENTQKWNERYLKEIQSP